MRDGAMIIFRNSEQGRGRESRADEEETTCSSVLFLREISRQKSIINFQTNDGRPASLAYETEGM